MEPSYQLSRLSEGTAAAAYPLVREVAGAGSLDEWLRFVAARQNLNDESGIMVLRRDGYVRGVFAWRLTRDLANRPVLSVELFAVLDTLLRQSASTALLDGLEALARRLGAATIAADLEPGSDLMNHFRQRGFVVGSIGVRGQVCKHQEC